MDNTNDTRSFNSLVAPSPPWTQDGIEITSSDANDVNTKDETAPAPELPGTEKLPAADPGDDALDAYIAVIMRDGLDRPIPNLPVKVEVPGVPPVETTTSEHGAVVVPLKDGQKEATLHVRDETAQYQEVCKIDPAKCTTGTVVVRSPKIVEKVALRPHHARRPTSSSPSPTPAPTAPATSSGEHAQPDTGSSIHSWYRAMREWLKSVMHSHNDLPSALPHDAQRTIQVEAANKSGNPIAIIAGPECPNADNLLLGRNGIYRQVILDAAKRYKISPQALAALIDAEAAKIKDTIPLTNPDGTPKLIKNGKNKGKQAVREIGTHWDAKSANPIGAAGLTQFIVDTWLRHTTKHGCYINEQCTAKGWVKAAKDKHGKATCVFVLVDGSTTDKPWQHQSDSNVRACLDQRFVAEWAIMAAADFGVANLGKV